MTTLRLAHASDLHCCERMRLDDWIALHRILVEQIADTDCHLTVLTGDLFHAKSTPAERNAMAGFLLDLARIAPVVVVKGNHDAAGDLDIFRCLEVDHPICVFDRPNTESVQTPAGVVCAIALPWFDRANLVAGLSATVDQETTRNMTIEAARGLLVSLRAESVEARRVGMIPILAAHVMVGGCETSTGQTIIGTTVELAPSDLLDVGAEYAALGHVHKAQEWHGGRVAYAGSTWRQNFGEPEAKGWRLVTFEDGHFISNEFVELPARRIVLIEADCTEGILSVDDSGVRPGDLVRYRYTVRAADLHTVDEDEIRQALLVQGAHEVKLEAVIVQETRVRSEAIVSARSNLDRVMAYLAAKGETVDAETMARIAAKLAELEARHGAEVAA